VARECADWIRRKATFRSNRGNARIPGFIGVARPSGDRVYQPVAGFTTVDLGEQPGDDFFTSIHRHDVPAETGRYLQAFDQIWADPDRLEDVTTRIGDHIARVYRENSPQRIYFLMLYHLFSEFLEDITADVLPDERTGYLDSLVWKKLYAFQRDAATGIINKLETCNGCILADSVGLGKTFTALAVVKYYERRNKSVLVLCPKKLAENWTNYNGNYRTNPFRDDRFGYDVLCHTDLLRERGESLGIQLDRIAWGNYDLVVIDESHNFRNADSYKNKETRYDRLMESVIRSGVQTRVLMLSATPVNNRFADLKNQLALAYEGDSARLTAQLGTGRDVEEVFRRAQAAFNAWSKLPAEERTAENILNALDFDFFELLDRVTIARSRKHIEQFYDTTEIGGFPERMPPQSNHCGLTSRSDVIGFNEIFARLSTLTLAVYTPLAFVQPSRLPAYEALYDSKPDGGSGTLSQAGREKGLQALMTTNLLKRLESSVHAFRLTLEMLERRNRDLIADLDAFERDGTDAGVLVNGTDGLDDEDDGFDAASPGGKVRVKLADMDVVGWRDALVADRFVVEGLLAEMRKVTPEHDRKLQHLKTQIDSKLASPINPGNAKLLIFTAFADTADYLYENLAQDHLARHGRHTAVVTGSSPPRSTLTPGGRGSQGRRKGHTFQELLTLFSPRSKEKAALMPDEPGEIDLLIGTDCISEGQNLQDCDTVVNYDIHWNPVRIIQRFGRIDRIGSPNARIQLVNYWPDITLDEYINLKERVENRMVIADAVATADDNVLRSDRPAPDGGVSDEVSYRREQLRRLQTEVVEMEDLRTGVNITDLGLNDFRMDLVNHLEEHQEVATLPGGMHAVVPADPSRGLVPGAIFTLRNRHPELDAKPRHRLHPYYLVQVADDGTVVSAHTDVKALLDRVRAACRHADTPVPAVCEPFNRDTDDGRDMSHCSRLLDAAIASILGEEERRDVESLFADGGQSAGGADTVRGLDDFELMSFLVIRQPVIREPGR